MKRREAREVAFKLTYEMVMTGAFNPETADSLTVCADKESREYILAVTDGIAAHRDGIKAVIAKYARGYGVDRIYRTDLAALYLACYEIVFTDTPKAVVANEAVELTKAYSDSLSYSFVNGIIASVIKAAESGELTADNIDAATAEADAAEAETAEVGEGAACETESGNG